MSDETERPPFDPTRLLTTIRTKQGPKPYLPLWGRVAWLRHDHPTARIISEELFATDKAARFCCTITLMDGACAVAHAYETAGAFPDFYEKAESSALSRACAMLGYGTEGAEELEDRVQAEDRADMDDPVVAMGDVMEHRAQRWLTQQLPRAGVVLPQRFERWGDVVGAMTIRGIDMTEVLRDGGVSQQAIRALVQRLVEAHQQQVGDS